MTHKVNPQLEAMLRRDPRVLAAIAKQVGQPIYDESQVDVPVDTGELKESGFVEIGEDRVRVGYAAGHAPFVEAGTKNAPAQPFLFPNAIKHRTGTLDL